MVLAAGGSARSVLDFSLESIDGQRTPLEQFRGKVLLLGPARPASAASPQYKELEEISRYQGRGLVILGFPASNFLWQEPGTNQEIKQFCLINYRVSFPMFSKISVAGKDIHPCTSSWSARRPIRNSPARSPGISPSSLVDRQSNVVARFAPKQVPDDPQVIAAIEKALQVK